MVSEHVGDHLVEASLLKALHVLAGFALSPLLKVYNRGLSCGHVFSKMNETRRRPDFVQPSPGITPIPAFSDNYIWLISNGRQAAVIDPGQSEPVLQALQDKQLTHVGGVKELVAQTHAKVWGPATEVLPLCDNSLSEGDTFEDSTLQLKLSVLDIPGHTAGHIAFFGTFRSIPVLFCGDTLFAAGCGRVFEGTPTQMEASLTKLAALPAHTRVFCAHEYTLSNMRWARTVEPDNVALQQWHEHAIEQRRLNQPTLPSSVELELACNPFLRVRQPSVVQAATNWAQSELTTAVEVFAALREWKNNFR
jgi:hydroxyacylglutathione hydrolase